MANITKVNLLAVPLESDYEHTIYFANANDQYNYFVGKTKKEYTDFSFQRHDNIIRVPEHIDTLIAAGCNYVMYKNPSFSNKWFYAFIVDMEYINDGRTDVKIRTDCMQTWMFNITVKPSFVEREHAASDELGEHTLDEQLETGEFVLNKSLQFTYGSKMSIIVGVTKLLSEDKKTAYATSGSVYNGTYSGMRYFAFDYLDLETLGQFIIDYDKAGAGDSIQCMFIAPDILSYTSEGKVESGKPVALSIKPHAAVINKPYDTAIGWDYEITHEFSTDNIDGYIPRNKKLMCFPYRYLLVSNNAGATVPYKFERFYVESDDGTKTMYEPTFATYGSMTIGCSVRMIPLCYNGIRSDNEDEGINMGKFPALNWSSDAFTNWLTQNGVNIAVNVATGIAQIAGGIAMAAGSGGLGAAAGATTAIGGVTQITGTLTQIHQQTFAPVQSKGNLNSGDVTTARQKNAFFFNTMSVKKEIAAILDDYFDMYGYKCHRVKIPEKAHRATHWFTKTIDANIEGKVPQKDLQVIKDCYNRGITFWRSNSSFRDYSVENGIV